MGKYQLNLSLQRLAAIQIVILLLRKSSFNRLVERKSDVSRASRRSKRCKNVKIPPDLVPIEQVNAFISSKIEELVPESFRDDLRFVAESMQNHIYGWIELLFNKERSRVLYQFDDYMEHIQWTCIGTIDQTATVRSMYKSNILAKNYGTFAKLSAYCVEDCVKEILPKITRHYVPDTYTLVNAARRGTFHRTAILLIMPFYWDRHLKNREDEVIAQLKHSLTQMPYYRYDESYSLNENLFILSVIAREYSALRYFWELLDGDQKSRAMTKVAANRICQAKVNVSWYCEDVEVLVFLLQQLSFYGLEDMLVMMLESQTVICALLKWPWYSLIIEILEDTWKHHLVFDYTPIISRILHAFGDIKGIPNSRMDYRIIFQMIWDTDPFDMKKKLNYGQIMEEAVWYKAVAGLKWIINADELKERRQEFVNCALRYYKGEWEDSYDSLTVFVNVVLVTDEEREQFRSEVIAAWEYRRIHDDDLPPFN